MNQKEKHMPEHFDAIVVGAGPAGNATAYVMAKAGLNVLQIERGEFPGAKNVQGAILYAEPLDSLMPDFREDAPLERRVIEQRMWMLDDTSYIGMHYRSEDFNEERPNRYTIIRTQFDKWFSRKVKEAGALLLCETTVTELVKDDHGKVIGVRTDREGDPILADVVVLGEGVNGLLGQRAGLRSELAPEQVALAAKEMHFLPQEVIESRFNLAEGEGVVIEAMGTVTHGMVGTGFIYTNNDSLSVGIGCLVSDFVERQISPYELLETFKNHPAIRPLLQGSEIKEYSAHLIPEGGFKAVPELCGDGWIVVGDAGHFVNGVHREGSNLAITTGRIAAETIVELKQANKPLSAKNLASYKKALEASFVMKDLKKYKNLPSAMHKNKHMFDVYPRLMSQAAQNWFRVDGKDKLTKEREIVGAFRKERGISGLVGDAFRMARAWR
jgi:electron transfer flavoprotein-quinone oxidoreductase